MAPLLPELFGHKTTALFDLWSMTHFLSGIGIMSVIALLRRSGRGVAHPFLLALTMSALWEIIEIYLELGLAGGGVMRWFDGVEHWTNRLITDQLLFVAGVAVAQRRPALIWPAKLASTAWLLAHIFLLPHSMALQERWFGYATEKISQPT